MNRHVFQEDLFRGELIARDATRTVNPEACRIMSRSDETKPSDPKFDFSAFPEDACFHERRTGQERRREPPKAEPASPPKERRVKRERRKRIDPTTFERQYTDEELEFMNAMQRFKVLSGKTFPSYGDVLDIAYALGYRQPGEPEPAVLPVLPLPGIQEK